MPDPFEWYGNLVEAVFWFTLAVGFSLAAIRPAWRTHKLAVAATLAAFGGSDLVEMHTGQWWDPWWLLAWKVSCVLVLAVLTVTYLRVHYRQQRQARH